jgi:hypothetical protein
MMHLTSKDAIVNSVHVKTSLVVLLAVLSSCGDDLIGHPDSALPTEDAVIDNSVEQGCMGNLPTSRTVTINPGDPIPGTIINELQDMVVGGRRPSYTVKIPFRSLVQTSSTGALTVVDNPSGGTQPFQVVKFISPGSLGCRIALPFTIGDTLTAFSMDVYGNGVVDSNADLEVRDQAGASVASLATVSSGALPASWSVISVATSSTLPRVMLITDVLVIRPFTAAAGTLHYGHAYLTFRR